MKWRNLGKIGRTSARFTWVLGFLLVPAGASAEELVSSVIVRESVPIETWTETRPADGGGSRFHFMAEMIAVFPRYESNPAYNLLNVGVGVGGIQSIDRKVEEFDYAPSLTPRLTLGMTGPAGNQFRTRWWHYDHNARPVNFANPPPALGDPVLARSVSSMSPLLSISALNTFPAVTSAQAQGVPAATDLLHFSNGLEFDIFDFEFAMAGLEIGDWSLLFTGGVRYAHIGQSYDAFSAGNATQYLTSRQRFDGVGPVVGLEARRPLRFLGLAVHGISRLGYLYGEHDFSMSGLTLGLIPPFTPRFNTNSAERRRFLPTFEVEGGVEGRYSLGRAELSLNLGILVQGMPIGSGNSGNGNVGLFGVILGSGLRY